MKPRTAFLWEATQAREFPSGYIEPTEWECADSLDSPETGVEEWLYYLAYSLRSGQKVEKRILKEIERMIELGIVSEDGEHIRWDLANIYLGLEPID